MAVLAPPPFLRQDGSTVVAVVAIVAAVIAATFTDSQRQRRVVLRGSLGSVDRNSVRRF
jgi:hypothetical protein